MEASAIETTRLLLDRHAVRQNFFLAKTEFAQLHRPPPWTLLELLGPRLHVLGCPEDIWMTSLQYQEVLKRLTPHGMSATWVEVASHAYVTSREQTEEVTKIIAAYILGSLGGAGETGAKGAGGQQQVTFNGDVMTNMSDKSSSKL